MLLTLGFIRRLKTVITLNFVITLKIFRVSSKLTSLLKSVIKTVTCVQIHYETQQVTFLERQILLFLLPGFTQSCVTDKHRNGTTNPALRLPKRGGKPHLSTEIKSPHKLRRSPAERKHIHTSPLKNCGPKAEPWLSLCQVRADSHAPFLKATLSQTWWGTGPAAATCSCRALSVQTVKPGGWTAS